MKRTAKTIIPLMAAIVLAAGVFARGAQADKPHAEYAQQGPVIASSTHQQHMLADLVSARIRAGLRGQSYSIDQDCDGDDCVISVHH